MSAREDTDERRERLLADLAAEGSARCCYAPGCISPEAWITGRCDCKYVNPIVKPNGEETGCCEMRAAYRVLAEAVRDTEQEPEAVRDQTEEKLTADVRVILTAALSAAREDTERTVLDVWVCTTCGEIQPRRGVDAHCAGSATEGLAHVDAPMWATTATIAAREDTERPGGGRIQELEEVVRACRSALICREALTPLFAEKIRVALRDTEQEHKR